jgi:hypothetical protein
VAQSTFGHWGRCEGGGMTSSTSLSSLSTIGCALASEMSRADNIRLEEIITKQFGDAIEHPVGAHLDPAGIPAAAMRTAARAMMPLPRRRAGIPGPRSSKTPASKWKGSSISPTKDRGRTTSTPRYVTGLRSIAPSTFSTRAGRMPAVRILPKREWNADFDRLAPQDMPEPAAPMSHVPGSCQTLQTAKID